MLPYLIGACLGFISGCFLAHKYYNNSRTTKLWFFPDQKLPCFSYSRSLTSNYKVKCTNAGSCAYYHYNDFKKSSLMKVMDSMKKAQQIDLCMYRFTLTHIGNLLIALKERGARIRIITDNAREPIDNNQIPRMKQVGIEVREKENQEGLEDKGRPLMHNKFVIIDNNCCLLGSFNWTHAAVTRNHESVVKSFEPSVVKPLAEKFNQMWNEFE